ncbi:MAG: ribonuclease R [Clostridia bacterium]|nr:ribonuclease R [Clostridia bacterium]
MRDSAYRPLTFGELVDVFDVPPSEHDAFRRLLGQMEAEGLVVRTRTARYGVPERMNLVVGTFQGHMKGFGFVLPDRPDEEDVYVSADASGGAMHGDRVVARVERSGPDGRRREGEVIRVLKRAVTKVVGTLERHRGHGFVVPDDRRLTQDVYVAKADLGGARDGEKVIVEITRWPSPRRGAEGRVIERLGRPDEVGVDVKSLMFQYGLPSEFPAEVEEEARRVPDRVSEAELKGRWDLRDREIFTIDGADAKDLDDAVSLERLKPEAANGAAWRLGVHIADVSHYVREGSALDREARERGTSVYLVDRVVPMLPARLSNGICSLNPGEDRLTLTVTIDFDPDGQPLRHRIAPSVIRSRRRFTYDEVEEILAAGRARGADARFVPTLRAMDELAQKLGALRRERGSIDFDLPEPAVVLDERGQVRDVKRRSQDRAHKLIEEFMVAANETVARHFLAQNVPFVYRVHEPPEPEKVQAFQEFLFNFGIAFQTGKEPSPRAFQEVLERIRGREEEHLISQVMLRTMRQARYATEPLGHFGLAARWYTHFTSPIRRYPDLVIHRIAHEVLEKGQLSARRVGVLLRTLPEVAAHASLMERRAMEAERESVTLKLLQFMKDRVGETIDGIVSGVTAFGVFVQLPNLAEGLVHVSTLTDDYYKYHEKHYALIGERTGRRFRLGDRVRVKVARVDLQQRQMDFVLAEEGKGRGRTRARASGSAAEKGTRKRARAGAEKAAGARASAGAGAAAARALDAPSVAEAPSDRLPEATAATRVDEPAAESAQERGNGGRRRRRRAKTAGRSR